jgi:hypothetical protein
MPFVTKVVGNMLRFRAPFSKCYRRHFKGKSEHAKLLAILLDPDK